MGPGNPGSSRARCGSGKFAGCIEPGEPRGWSVGRRPSPVVTGSKTSIVAECEQADGRARGPPSGKPRRRCAKRPGGCLGWRPREARSATCPARASPRGARDRGPCRIPLFVRLRHGTRERVLGGGAGIGEGLEARGRHPQRRDLDADPGGQESGRGAVARDRRRCAEAPGKGLGPAAEVIGEERHLRGARHRGAVRGSLGQRAYASFSARALMNSSSAARASLAALRRRRPGLGAPRRASSVSALERTAGGVVDV
jgi:hypothetical protein